VARQRRVCYGTNVRTRNVVESVNSPTVRAIAIAVLAFGAMTGCQSKGPAANQNSTPSTTQPSPVAAPAKAEFGNIEVTSKPSGARVLVIAIEETGASEPQPRGVTPTTITRLSPGKYTVDVEYPGYRYYQQTVEVKADATVKVNAALRK